MIEDKTKVVPMMVPESTDPYVFDTTTQEFVKIELTEMGLVGLNGIRKNLEERNAE